MTHSNIDNFIHIEKKTEKVILLLLAQVAKVACGVSLKISSEHALISSWCFHGLPFGGR